MNFDQAFDRLIGFEGDYSNSPSDPGGETRFGVTRRVALQEGYDGDMHVLSRDFAKAVYRKRYWNVIKADQLPGAVRYTVFDGAVNSGPKQAIQWLQRALNVVDDGILGPVTLSAATAANGPLLGALFNGERLEFMTSLPTWTAYGKGWARRIAANLKGLA